VLTEHATRIAELAESLARSGREDDEAATELRRLAGDSRRWRRPLAEAAQLFKVNGEYLETRWRHRAVRLLAAAANGQPVPPEEPDQRARFDLLEHLSELAPELAFEELAAREPRLLTLREQLLSARAHAVGTSDFARWLRGSSVVHHELVALVGHARPDFDPVCSAVLAYAIASAYLADLAAAS
jgi:hypothetical protein